MAFTNTFVFSILLALLSGPWLSAQAQIKRVATSFASSTRHEAELSLSRIQYESYKYEEKNTDINIYGGYHYHYQDGLQFGGEGGVLAFPDGGDTKTLPAIMGIITYNFNRPIREGFFVQGGLGLYPAYDEGNNTEPSEFESSFSMLAGVGMRYEVWGKINFKPYFRIWKRGDEDTRLELQVLNFSIFY